MFTFILNSSNLLQDKKGTIGHYAVIAVAHEVNEENLQKVADQVKERFGLTLDTMTGTTSDPETFLTISTTTLLK